MAYTKGPWEKKNGSLRVQVKDNPCVAICYTDTFGTSGEAAGNAHLIAAAPDLLEALKALWCDIVEYNVINHMPQANNNHAMLQAVAAMAKAEGK